MGAVLRWEVRLRAKRKTVYIFVHSPPRWMGPTSAQHNTSEPPRRLQNPDNPPPSTSPGISDIVVYGVFLLLLWKAFSSRRAGMMAAIHSMIQSSQSTTALAPAAQWLRPLFRTRAVLSTPPASPLSASADDDIVLGGRQPGLASDPGPAAAPAGADTAAVVVSSTAVAHRHGSTAAPDAAATVVNRGGGGGGATGVSAAGPVVGPLNPFAASTAHLIHTHTKEHAVAAAQHARAVRILLVALLVVAFVIHRLGVPQAARDMYAVVSAAPKGSFKEPAKMLALAADIKAAAHDNLFAVTAMFCTLSVVLLTFCIPGTIMLNVLFGALLDVSLAVPLCVSLGALGGTFCYGLSSLAGAKVAERLDAKLLGGKGIPNLRRQVDRYRKDLLAYLLFLRLTPILPNWLINIASPVVGVPLRIFVIATVIGITPQTYLACRFGSLVSQLAQAQGIRSIVTLQDTILIAFLGVAVVGLNQLKRRFSASTASAGHHLHHTGHHPASSAQL